LVKKSVFMLLVGPIRRSAERDLANATFVSFTLGGRLQFAGFFGVLRRPQDDRKTRESEPLLFRGAHEQKLKRFRAVDPGQLGNMRKHGPIGTAVVERDEDFFEHG
jgi:hypothetical protein